MTRSHKPSSWQPTNWQFDDQMLEEVKKCYPPQVMKEIIKAARLEKIEPNSVKRRALAKIVEQNIMNLAAWTINWSKLPNRPSPAQRKAALKRIEKKVHALNEALKALDYDSSDDLRRTTLSDPFSYGTLGTDPKVDSSHPQPEYVTFQTMLAIIGKLEQWAVTAQEYTQRHKDGDRRADVKRWFAEGIIDIWIMIGHKKPTLSWRGDLYPPKTAGSLMEFTNAAARPFDLLPMEAALRHATKQWRNTGPKPPRENPYII